MQILGCKPSLKEHTSSSMFEANTCTSTSSTDPKLSSDNNLISGETRRRKNKNRSSIIITSTPNRVTLKSEPDNSLFSIDERFVELLRSIPSIKHEWNSAFKASCITFTNLATILSRFHSGSIDLKPNEDFIYEFYNLLSSGKNEQARKLSQGEYVEKCYDTLQKQVDQLKHCYDQLALVSNQLKSLHLLLEKEDTNLSTPTGSKSINLSVTGMNKPVLIFWEPLTYEIQGLLNCLSRDLNFREYLKVSLANISISYYSCNQNLIKTVSLWRHLGSFVSWITIIEIVQHILDVFGSDNHDKSLNKSYLRLSS